MKKQLSILLKLPIEVDTTKKFVKIRAHKRTINGKAVKSGTHLRHF